MRTRRIVDRISRDGVGGSGCDLLAALHDEHKGSCQPASLARTLNWSNNRVARWALSLDEAGYLRRGESGWLCLSMRGAVLVRSWPLPVVDESPAPAPARRPQMRTR